MAVRRESKKRSKQAGEPTEAPAPLAPAQVASPAPEPEPASEPRPKPAPHRPAADREPARQAQSGFLLHGRRAPLPPPAIRGRRRPGPRRPVAQERHPAQPDLPGLSLLRNARRRQDLDGPDLRQVLELRARPHRQPLPDLRHLPGNRRRARCRRHRDRWRQQQRRRAGARAQAARLAPAQPVAIQDLLHRRSAHALDRGVQRPLEDPRRAAATRQVPLRHHRAQQDSRSPSSRAASATISPASPPRPSPPPWARSARARAWNLSPRPFKSWPAAPAGRCATPSRCSTACWHPAAPS